jgi:hypothetical protein
MTHNDSPHGTPAAEASPFTPAMVEAFHQDDRRAAAAIVLLMAGIFTLGLLGYLAVCYWVA